MLVLAGSLCLPPIVQGAEEGLEFPKPVAPDAPLDAKIRKAIEAGLKWLRLQQKGNGSFFDEESDYGEGTTALATYTLAACGTEADRVLVRRGMNWLSGPCNPYPRDHMSTYLASLILLTLERYEPTSQEDGAGVGPEDRRKWIQALVDGLVRAQCEDGGFSYGAGERNRQWDNSNSQFASLGLLAARRCGADIPEEVWIRCVRHFVSCQAKRGPSVARVWPDGEREGKWVVKGPRDVARGWTYGPTSDPEVASFGSMTAGAVSSLLAARLGVVRSRTKDWRTVEPLAIKGIRDGFAWLDAAFTVYGNPVLGFKLKELSKPMKTDLNHYYYLWSVERACSLADAGWIGRHDWFKEGAEYLLDRQEADGSWMGASEETPGIGRRQDVYESGDARFMDTCFALLFLARATRRLAVTRATATERD